MKKIILFFLILPVFCMAQDAAPAYFDWQWKPCDASLARFVALQKKTDSGWLRNDYYLSNNTVQMSGLFTDSACKNKNGFFRYYYPSGVPSSYGNYVNDKKEGVWISVHPNGMVSDSVAYRNNLATGISLSWYPNGYTADSTFYNEDGTAVGVGWFDNGNPSYAGRYANLKRDGRWRFFHKNGNTAALETYTRGRLMDSTYFDEEGKPVGIMQYPTREAAFTGGIEKWRRYLENKLQFPENYKLINTHIITVVVRALVDEEGNVLDAFIDIPFKKPFDEEALRVVKKSPRWQPAAKHNRRVQMYIRQPVSFAQEE